MDSLRGNTGLVEEVGHLVGYSLTRMLYWV